MITGPEPIAADDLSAFERAARRAFHDDAHPAEVEMDVRLLEPERSLVVRDGGEIVGTTAALTQHVTVPGGAIYGRYGYGLATRGMTFELRLPGAAIRPTAPRPRERARLLDVAEALPQMQAVYEAVRPHKPGLFARTPVWWERRTFDPEHRRRGAGILRA